MSVASEEALSRELPVVEIFDSIQGEGYYIGQLSTFVRLAGCNMNPPCAWCIAKGQRVTMADGSWKPIEEVQVGDFVLGIEDPETKEHTRFAPAEVLAAVNQGVKPLWSLNGLLATGDHRVLTQTQRSRYTAIQELRMHDTLVAIPEPEPQLKRKWQNLLGRAVRSIEYVDEVTPLEEEAEVYDLTTTTGNFFAEGICVHNCDTAYAQGYEDATRMSIADIIKRCTQAHVVITGGEPLVHARVVELCDQLYRRGKLVTVETNGTIHRPALRWICNLISISPKLESAGHQPNLDVVGAYVRTANHFGNVQIKFVIGSDKDWEMALKAIGTLYPLSGGNPIYWAFQPKADPDDCIDDLLMKAESLSTTIVTSNLGERLQHVRVLPQLHRLLWGTQRGV